MTSEPLGLGESDAEVRWIGVRRHQAVVVVAGVGLASEWVMGSRANVAELVMAIVLLASALPSVDGLTLGEHAFVVAHFVGRSHWQELQVREFGDDVVLWARGEVAFRGYELVHRGRLDLSGRDVALAEGLAALADALSATSDDQHLAQHVRVDGNRVTTVLTLPLATPPPEGWLANNEVSLGLLGASRDDVTLRRYERFTYVRTPSELVRIFRVRDFSSVPSTRPLLEQLLRSPTPLDLSLHVDVVSAERAHRLAARAAHRVGSDDAASRSAGFRRSARSARHLERLAQREVLVASGRSLLRVAVFVIVRASNLDELQRRSTSTWRHAHDAGLRLERGRGRQAPWYRAQLPGGAGW